MKKNKSIVIYVIIGLLAICLIVTFYPKSKTSPKMISSNLNTPFTANATIDYDGFIMECDINKTDIGKATFLFTSPKAVNGLSLAFDGEDVDVSYKGITMKLNGNSKLMQTATKILIDAIDTAANPNDIDIDKLDDGVLIKGENSNSEFKIKLDKNNVISSIQMPSLNLKAEFSH